MIPFQVVESNNFNGIDGTLLISIPNSDRNAGLVMLENGKLFSFALPACTGLWLSDNKLFVSVTSADCMKLKIYEPGQEVKTIVSSKLGDVHDVLLLDEELYVVSTGTNEVVIVDMTGRISKSWKLQGFGDSCHINCLDIWNGRLIATAFGKFTTYRGYKGKTQGSGIVFDVKTQEIISNGYSAPHTPRRDTNGATYICDSRAESVTLDYRDEKKVISFPGSFPRGLALTENTIYVGLSSLRHRADIDYHHVISSAQVAIVDKKTLEVKKRVSLPQTEIYDVLFIRN